MRSALLPGLITLLAAAWAALGAAAPQARSPAPPSAASRHAEFKVAIWYRRDRPLDTFRYQIYDLRKGEYTGAVDDWLTLMRTRFPGYESVVRDVDLSREKGETESLKVGSIIRQELLAAAALEGVFIGGAAGGPSLSRGPRLGLPPRPELMGRPSPLGPWTRSTDRPESAPPQLPGAGAVPQAPPVRQDSWNKKPRRRKLSLLRWPCPPGPGSAA